MENMMNKEQVIEATINVLNEISVPVRLKEQISDPISGAIMNLVIVLQMIQAENAANEQRAAEQRAAVREETGDQEEGEPVKKPIRLFGEEAEENGREADTE